MESHVVSMENFVCFGSHGLPWSIKPGPLFYRIAGQGFGGKYP